MKVALDWLNDYVALNSPPKELSHLLTMSGLEIEEEETVELSEGKKTEVFELNVTPNRGYCLSHIGVAREIASLTEVTCQVPDVENQMESQTRGRPAEEVISVDNLETSLCPRYAAMVIENVKVCPSPQWLQDRLLSIGLRPINNIVDITNFVMMEYGQPLHAFDLNLLTGQKIVIRKAKSGEPFSALDGTQLKLQEDALVIADGEKAVALAGIMGGTNSQVTLSTQTVVLESAFFDSPCIRKSSKKYGLRSDSSYRFERGVDIEGVITAQTRAALLIQELAGGTICAGRFDIYPQPQKQKEVDICLDRVRKVLGQSFDVETLRALFERMGLILLSSDSNGSSEPIISLKIPTFRPDLTREIDVIEEIARLTGYGNLPVIKPKAELRPIRLTSKQECQAKFRERLSALGYQEAVNYSFLEQNLSEQFSSIYGTSDSQTVSLRNPISSDLETMRTSLIPSLIKTASRNLSKGQKPVKVFELGNIYFQSGKDGCYEERSSLAVLASGPYESSPWKQQGKVYDFYDIKGILESVIKSGSVHPGFEAKDTPFFKRGRSAQVLLNGKSVGIIGELDTKLLKQWELAKQTSVFEIHIGAYLEAMKKKVRFTPISKFPETFRDISIVVDKSLPSQKVCDLIRETGSPLVDRVELYDLFEGKQFEKGKKSLTFALSFVSPDKTLTDDEVNPVFDNILSALNQQFGATLRDS